MVTIESISESIPMKPRAIPLKKKLKRFDFEIESYLMMVIQILWPFILPTQITMIYTTDDCSSQHLRTIYPQLIYDTKLYP